MHRFDGSRAYKVKNSKRMANTQPSVLFAHPEGIRLSTRQHRTTLNVELMLHVAMPMQCSGQASCLCSEYRSINSRSLTVPELFVQPQCAECPGPFHDAPACQATRMSVSTPEVRSLLLNLGQTATLVLHITVKVFKASIEAAAFVTILPHQILWSAQA